MTAVCVAVIAATAAGCSSGGEHETKQEVVAVVGGTPIYRSQLDRAVEHARTAAKRLDVAVPTAAVYEFAEEQGEGEPEGESSAARQSAEDPAFVRSTVRAQLLYEAVGRKVTAGARGRRGEVERYYRAHRAELERAATTPARARLYAETLLLRRRQAAMLRSWVSALERGFRPRVRYSDGY